MLPITIKCSVYGIIWPLLAVLIFTSHVEKVRNFGSLNFKLGLAITKSTIYVSNTWYSLICCKYYNWINKNLPLQLSMRCPFTSDFYLYVPSLLITTWITSLQLNVHSYQYRGKRGYSTGFVTSVTNEKTAEERREVGEEKVLLQFKKTFEI